MAVHYGFYSLSETSPMRQKAKEKFDALHEHDKDRFHNYLPVLLMGCGIGAITPQTRPVIAGRCASLTALYLLCASIWHSLEKTVTLDQFQAQLIDELEVFDGYITNVYAESFRSVQARYAQRIPTAFDRKLESAAAKWLAAQS
jgi:hypothetical protein